MAQSYLEGAVKFCQEVVDAAAPDAGIFFDPEVIGQTMTDPPPGWNGYKHEAAHEVWWKDYMDQVLKVVPLRGPEAIPYFESLKELGPSTSVDPDFLMEEEEELDTDYSALLGASPPSDQSATPGDGSDFSTVFPNDPPVDPYVI